MDRKKLQKLEKLAMIEIGEEDRDRILDLVNRDILGVKALQDIDTENLEPLTNPYDMFLETHKDTVSDGNLKNEILACAPNAVLGYFAVPKMMES
ncbi:MAG: Asp-tRNA(Asn)/Glu-tRNA(Gln) amidotransferase subunit GatC [Rickettsiales bacterium]|jgi:aspartyl-tRNA(Asn)/glutamyl-tRNA(Gln) amidotransferase subunit C|nr:Asp-tRNA(Asn)/Glu-tRNA(Gln) amidotransferase subunit GatC [Rickettsiales bacterium]